MPAGNIALTNGSATVTGTGTSFTTELKTGDFLGVVVGGVPYTLIVSAIASDTSLTIATAFTGPTTGGLAWNAVPATLQTAITQQAMNDMSRVLRGMIQEKANWQQVYSGTGTITVKLPDGSTYSGPAWSGITASLNTKADKTSLDTYAKKGVNSDITSITGLTAALSVSQGGTGVTSINAFLSAAGFSNTANSFTVPCNGRNLRLVASSEVVTTNAAGEGTVSYKQAFPNSCIACIPVLGDAIGTDIIIINYALNRTSSFDYRIYDGLDRKANTTVRINYIAIGY